MSRRKALRCPHPAMTLRYQASLKAEDTRSYGVTALLGQGRGKPLPLPL